MESPQQPEATWFPVDEQEFSESQKWAVSHEWPMPQGPCNESFSLIADLIWSPNLSHEPDTNVPRLCHQA